MKTTHEAKAKMGISETPMGQQNNAIVCDLSKIPLRDERRDRPVSKRSDIKYSLW